MASPVAPTGAERSLALIGEQLRARGCEVVVVTPGPWRLRDELSHAGVRVVTVPVRVCWMSWFEKRSPLYAAFQWRRFHLLPKGRGRLARALSEIAPDVVLVNCLPHVVGAETARRLGLPVVWRVAEIPSPGPRRRWFAGRLQRHADRIIAVSEAVAEWIREEGLGERLAVVRNGIALMDPPPDAAAARRALGLPPEGCQVGLFGQLRPHKGALEFIAAARMALAQAPELRFVLAGSGPAHFIRSVRREANADPVVGGRIHLLPAQPSGATLVAAADIVALTTLSPDPLPRVVLEAMASGRPVAAFDSGGAREMVVDGVTGILCPVGDVRALAHAFVRLARSPELRAEMGRQGLARARTQFSIQTWLDRIEEILGEAASRRNRD
jgi:glycosyltransferase involved in cell wall biosynthesis